MSQELEGRINKALESYHAAKKPNIASIAREFSIPYGTFRGRVQGRKPRNDRTAPHKALKPEQEKALILWIDTLDQAFSPPSTGQIHSAALQIVRRHDPNRNLGKNWAYNFIARLPLRFDTIRLKPMEKARFEAANAGYVVSWYDRLQITLKSYNITPRNLYNFDETRFRIGQGKPHNVISAR
jgi:hypothetical protein